MAKGPGATPTVTTAKRPVRPPAPAKPAAPVAKTAAPSPPKPRTSPAAFLREVRAEGRKITWTTWKETWITSVMVGIMVVTTAVFFSVVDFGLSFAVQQVLKLAG